MNAISLPKHHARHVLVASAPVARSARVRDRRSHRRRAVRIALRHLSRQPDRGGRSDASLLAALPPAGGARHHRRRRRRRALCGAGAQPAVRASPPPSLGLVAVLPAVGMVGRLRHAGRQHLRARLARPRLLAPRSRLRAARCRCAHPAAARPLGAARGLAVAAAAIAPSAALRGLERSVAAQGIRQPRRQLLARGAPASVAGASARWRRPASSGCRSASSATASGACGRRCCRCSTSSRRSRASRCSAS